MFNDKIEIKRGFIYGLHCFNFDADVFFYVKYKDEKVLYIIKTRLGYVFSLCFSKAVMKTWNAGISRNMLEYVGISRNMPKIFDKQPFESL